MISKVTSFATNKSSLINRSGGVGGLKDRFSPYCALVPSVLVLAICIMGLVMVLIYHNHYLTIPFAGGIAFSFYLVYLSYAHRITESLAKSAKKFERLGVQYQQTANRLSSEVTNLTTQNQTLATTVTKTGEQLNVATQHAASLQMLHSNQIAQTQRLQKITEDQALQIEQTNAARQALIDQVTQAHTTYQQNFAEFRKEASANTASATSAVSSAVSDATTKQHSALSGLFTLFDTQVKAQTEQNAKAGTNNDTMAKQLTELQTTATSLYEAIKLMVNTEKAVQSTLTAVSAVNATVADAEKRLATVTTTLQTSEATLKKLSDNLSEKEKAIAEKEKILREIEAKIQSAATVAGQTVERLSKHTTELGGHTRTLSDLMVRAESAVTALSPVKAPNPIATNTTATPSDNGVEGVPNTSNAVVS